MKQVCYIITAFRDPFELPLALFDHLWEVAHYVEVLPRQVYRHLRGEVLHVNGYVIHRVEL